MSKVLTLFAIGLLVWYWSLSQKSKATAISAARQRCAEAGVQFLDYTVVQKGFAFSHVAGRGYSLQRLYEFEFSSTGEHRYKGQLRMCKGRVTSIELDPWSINQG